MSDDIQQLTKALIEAKVIQAFKDTPEAIDALVQAALSQPVSEYGGKPDAWSSNKMPYLTWLVGDVIRAVARDAVIATVKAREPEIHEAIRKAVSADALVDSVAQKMLGALAEDWKLVINFANEKRRD
jgi:hypothetical protein